MSESTDKDLRKDLSKGDLPDGDLPDEQQLDEYLRGGSAVSRQYRQLRSADVPTELDRLVLRQAQDAVKARPAKSRAWVRWTGPLALAASAVLVVSIVIESGVRDEAFLSVPASAPIETRVQEELAEKRVESRAIENTMPEADASRNKAPVVPIIPVDPGLSPPQMYFEPAPIQASPPVEERAFVPSTIRPAAPPPVAAPKAEITSPAEKVEPPPAELARRQQVDPGPQTATVAPAPASARVREVDTTDHDLSQVVVTGSRARSIGDQESASVVQSAMRGDQSRIAGPRNSVAVPAAGSSDGDEQVDEPRSDSDPEQWLRGIRQLRKQKKHDEADREWRRFRSVFPNYTVAETDPARGAVR